MDNTLSDFFYGFQTFFWINHGWKYFVEVGNRRIFSPKSLCKRLEAFFSGTSRQHHAEEERSVFPPLLSSGNTELANAVRTLQQDHGWIEENWIELAPRLRAIALGNGWTDPTEFQNYVEVFTELMDGHIALEETLIYPESKDRWAQAVSMRRSP